MCLGKEGGTAYISSLVGQIGFSNKPSSMRLLVLSQLYTCALGEILPFSPFNPCSYDTVELDFIQHVVITSQAFFTVICQMGCM